MMPLHIFNPLHIKPSSWKPSCRTAKPRRHTQFVTTPPQEPFVRWKIKSYGIPCTAPQHPPPPSFTPYIVVSEGPEPSFDAFMSTTRAEGRDASTEQSPPAERRHTLLSRLDDLQSKRQQIDRAILKTSARLNSLCGLHTLPVETLTMILLHYKDNHCAYSEKPTWLRASFVCKHWRSITIGTPQFWNNISINWSGSCIKTFIARSRSTPLAIYGPLGPQTLETLRFILKDAHRLTEIFIHALKARSEMLLFELLAERAPGPLLRRLVYMDNYHRDDVGQLSDQYFSEAYPNLRELFLRDISIRSNLHIPLFSGLTRLSLLSGRRAEPPSCVELVGMLGSCPLLAELSLYSILLDDTCDYEEEVNSGQCVDLNYLRSITISDNLEACIHCWGHLSYPETVEVHMYLVSDRPDGYRDADWDYAMEGIKKRVNCKRGAAFHMENFGRHDEHVALK